MESVSGTQFSPTGRREAKPVIRNSQANRVNATAMGGATMEPIGMMMVSLMVMSGAADAAMSATNQMAPMAAVTHGQASVWPHPISS